jgi:ribosomal protein S7
MKILSSHDVILSRHNYYLRLYDTYHHLFFRSLIFRGRKIWAFNFFVNLKFELKKRERIDPFWVLLVSLLKITPDFILLPRKLGGTTKYVGLPIIEKKRYRFAINFVIKSIRDKDMVIKIKTISDVLLSALQGQGLAIDKKMSIYNTALQNRYLIRFFK